MPLPPLDNEWDIQRQKECPAKIPGQCSLVTSEAGVRVTIDRKDCDRCWSHGGIEGGGPIRAAIVALVVSAAKRTPSAMSLKERELFEKHHKVNLQNQDPGKKDRWKAVESTWEMAGAFAKALASRGFSGKRVDLTIKRQRYVSCFGKTLEGEVVQAPCPSLEVSKDGQHHFCNDCGCGDRKIAWLDEENYGKLDYPYLECPRKRPGFSNQEPA